MKQNSQSEFWKITGDTWENKYINMNNSRGEKLVDFFSNIEIKSFMEVGCNSGRNLLYLSKKIPNSMLFGIEIAPKAAQKASENIPNAKIYNCDIHEFDCLDKYDVVFTGGVLMHIEPDLVKRFIEKCISMSKKYVIHMEPIGKNIITHGIKKYNPKKCGLKFRCEYDIEDLYKKIGFNIKEIIKYKDTEAFMVLEK